MSDRVSQADGPMGRVAAIYARVSSERQRQDETIQSQTVGLRELAAERGLLVAEDLVFEDEGFSGATLTRPALERLRDRAAEGAFEVLLCHAPDRLARRYAYQVLLLEEFQRVGRGGVLREGARAGRDTGGRAAAPVPGDDRRVRARADRRAHPPREAAPRPHRPPGGAFVRAHMATGMSRSPSTARVSGRSTRPRPRSCARCSRATSTRACRSASSPGG